MPLVSRSPTGSPVEYATDLAGYLPVSRCWKPPLNMMFDDEILMVHWLVVLTILKNISQMGRIITYIMENKTCSKPPTSNGSGCL